MKTKHRAQDRQTERCVGTTVILLEEKTNPVPESPVDRKKRTKRKKKSTKRMAPDPFR